MSQTIDNNEDIIKDGWKEIRNRKINQRYFEPLLGKAYKFYPKLYTKENKVRLDAKLNGKTVTFIETTIGDTAVILDFLNLIVKWRLKHLQTIYDVTLKQAEVLTNIEDDVINIHGQIRSLYKDNSIVSIIVLLDKSLSLIKETFNKYGDNVTYKCIGPDIYVNISRLHLKYQIEITFNKNATANLKNQKENARCIKVIDVILD